jgi:hypothetical protein
MTSALERRLRRLEQARGAPDDELIEIGLSDEGKALLRETLISFGKTPEKIEATVNTRQLLPRSCRLELSPAGRAQLEETLAMMQRRRPRPALSDIASGGLAG